MKKQQVVAIVLFAAVVAWMAIPRNAETVTEDAPVPATVVAVSGNTPLLPESADTVLVRAERIEPRTYVERIRVRGRTEPFRHVQVRAEEAGRIVSEPVPRGARVRAGDVLCELAVDNRQADLLEARSRREQAQFEYEASLDLQERGLQSDVVVAQLQAALESSRAAVSRAELALEKIRVTAPFDGIVESRSVELGDLLNVGTVCASVLDDSPMLLVGLVPEQDVGRIEVGARVHGELVSGRRVTGVVSYLARAAETVSRSYRIEVEVDPQHDDIRGGVTTELEVDSYEITAHLIPSSSLTLDDAGQIGVKLIDRDGIVYFNNVTIIGDDTNQLDPGIWVSGLNGTVNLVTVGQEIVFPGQQVTSDFNWPGQATRPE